jgi:hypothetical protein
MTRQFWWSGNLDNISMHWIAWDKLAIPKYHVEWVLGICMFLI